MASITQRFLAGASAFRDAFLSPSEREPEAYDAYDARQFRYALFRALYDASIYRTGVFSAATSYRQQFGLYKYIRAVESPVATIVDFWHTYLYGGMLDPNAGDGRSAANAIPIVTEQPDAFRTALGVIWQWSNWQANKDLLSLCGSRDGDVPIRIRDDVARGKVAMEPLDPMLIAELTLDPFGNVKGYVYEEARPHPDTGKKVLYREEVAREGENVVYTTFMEGSVYAWPGNVDAKGNARWKWSEPYGFVPLVWIKHIDVGQQFGRSELHKALHMAREMDDVGSAVDDQIRKSVAAPWLLAGVDDPKKARGGVDPRIPATTPTSTNPEPGRQDVPIFYGPVGAQPHPLVAPLDLAGVNVRLEAMHAKLRRDYPELDADIVTSAGDASGRALMVARQRAEAKAATRRAVYDSALVRAQQMAISIAGYRRLPGFQGFNLDSYAQGKLDHSIGERPVFAKSALDGIEEDQAFWAAAEQAVKAGADLRGYLESKGMSAKQIDQLVPPKPEPAPSPVLVQGFTPPVMQTNGVHDAAAE